MEIYNLTSYEIHCLFKKKEIKAIDVVLSCLKRIEEEEPKINAFITKTFERAIEKAKAIDEKIAKNEPISPLSGIPISIKDNICTKGLQTTCASHILQGFIPPYDATVITKLKDAGAIIIGKTNMDEFAFGSSCEHSCFGPTRNPHNLDYVPGGSSGGSAASVASGEAILSLGSDTGGSIRQPASFCGVVGLKPTYGLVSRYGLIAFASSFDQIGPLTKDVRDCAILLNTISGFDENDETSIKQPKIDYTSFLEKDISGMKIGIPKEYLEGVNCEVKEAIMNACKKLSSLNVEIIEVSLPHSQYAIPVYYIIACSEASSNLARFDGVQYGLREEDKSLFGMYRKTRSKGFGDEAKRRIILGTYALSSGYYDAYYLKAQKVRSLIKRDFDRAFSKVSLLITPTSPTPPFKIGEKTEDPLSMYLSDILTVSCNLTGYPAISIPYGKTKDSLPIGLQIIGSYLCEGKILSLAQRIEKLDT
ncbi:MAG: Asp-tRNA(Asn)/Glu-tRNA(Gln) amidotransferase subunit GatA [bacterium]